MKCARCGAELKEGRVYCSVCGKEAQIVPDYSLLEDDYLRSLLTEEDADQSGGKKKKKKKNPKNEYQISGKMPILLVCGLLFVFIVAGVSIKLVIDFKNANSYDYQMAMAEQSRSGSRYEDALNYYETALALHPQDPEARMGIAEVCIAQEDYDAAMVVLMDAIQANGNHLQAYQRLIEVYEAKGDFDGILALEETVRNAEIRKLFAPYHVKAPVISPVAGTYDDFMDVVIVSMEGCDIYYTTDGSTPDQKNGIRYDEESGITLDEEGEYEISAVCVNEKGICSEVKSATYEIRFEPPDPPSIWPNGGEVTEQTFIVLHTESDCEIYYTWDGSDPTRQSARYEGPIEVPPGNNILSVRAVNTKNGLRSGVNRANFIWYPDGVVPEGEGMPQ